jgi:hypothetical protein
MNIREQIFTALNGALSDIARLTAQLAAGEAEEVMILKAENRVSFLLLQFAAQIAQFLANQRQHRHNVHGIRCSAFAHRADDCLDVVVAHFDFSNSRPANGRLRDALDEIAERSDKFNYISVLEIARRALEG